MSSAGTTQPGRSFISSKPPMAVTAPVINQGVRLDEENNAESYRQSYDPERPGGAIFHGRSFKRPREQIQAKVQTHNKKKQSVRFADETELDDSGREVVKTNVGGLLIKTSKPYETLLAERDALLETDNAYRKRVKELEEENAQILLDYESMYKENNVLRDKLDKGDDSHIESYQRVYDDRQILREAESAYKKRITQLEQDAAEMLTNFDSLYAENKVLRDKGKKLEEKLNAIDRLDDIKKINELEKMTKQQAKTIRTMNYEREDLVKEKNILENQMYKLREDVSDVNRRNLLLERENEGLKRGFMALGQDPDESWRKELRQKTRRQEEEERIMREEHKQYKEKNQELEKINHDLEKTNVELKTRNEMLESNKADLEKQISELVKDSRNRTPSAEKRRAAEIANQKEKKFEELTKKLEEVQAENVRLETTNKILSKEKESFEEQMEKATKQPRETASSIRRKMETEREIRDLTNHVDTFKEKVKRLEIENQDLQEQIKTYEIEVKTNKQVSKAIAEGKANEMEGNMKVLNQKVISLNEDIKRLTDENLQLKADKNMIQDKLQGQIEAISKEKENLKNEKETLENSINETKTASSGKFQEMHDELNTLQVELQILKPKYESLTEENKTLKSEYQTISQSLEEKKNELEELRDTIRTNKDVYNELSKAQRDNASLKREIADIQRNFESEKIKQETDLEELLKNQEFMNTALAEHKVRLDMLHEEKNELKGENIKLVKANERQSKIIIDLKSDVEKATGEGTAQITALKEELETVKKKLTKSEKELIQTSQELEIVKNEKENQVNKLINQMNKLKNEREIETKQLNEQSESLRSEVARLKIFEDRIKNMEKNLKDLLDKLTEAEERNKKLTDQRLASLNQVVNEMKNENLANRIRNAEKEENELEKHRMELEIKQDAINEIRKLKAENAKLIKVIEDKQAAEEAQDEWTKKKNKFNEILAQNKRLEAENQRMLSLYEQSQTDTLKKDLQAKNEKLKLLESKYHSFSEENAKLKQAMEEKEIEMKKIESKVDRSNKAIKECDRLTAENKRLRDEIFRKDNQIVQLKELEVTSAKYIDASTNNQRLYEENMRLRETIEKSKDYKEEFQKMKGLEKSKDIQQSKYAEENTLLRSTLQNKQDELNREIELHKQRAENLQTRNKRLIDEVAKLKTEISKKDDLIIKLRDLETTTGKYKDANANIARLQEENQRLRNLLENNGWKSNFQNTRSLASSRTRPFEQKAVYVETSNTNMSKNSAEKQTKGLKRRNLKRTSISTEESDATEMQEEADDLFGTKMKIKPLMKLPEIKKETSGLTYGLTYQELHKKSKDLRGEKLIDHLNEEILLLRSKFVNEKREAKGATEELNNKTAEVQHLTTECDKLRAEVKRLMKENDIQAISLGLNKANQLQEQNKRLVAENQRLREEVTFKEMELTSQQSSGYTVATYMDSAHQPQKKFAQQPGATEDTREQLKVALASNKKLAEENNRLRAALDQINMTDHGSRFADQNVAGKIIEGFQTTRSKNWASKVDNSKQKRTNINETDDKKLLRLEDIN